MVNRLDFQGAMKISDTIMSSDNSLFPWLWKAGRYIEIRNRTGDLTAKRICMVLSTLPCILLRAAGKSEQTFERGTAPSPVLSALFN